MIAHGWSPEEIHFQHSHLSLAQIHAALGFYYDHKAEMDEQIHRGAGEVERMRSQSSESPNSQAITGYWQAGVSIGLYMDVHVPAAITRGLLLRQVNVLTARSTGRRSWMIPNC